MAETPYRFAISLETLNGKLSESGLKEEIGSSDSIFKALSYISRNGDIATVMFKDKLETSEETMFDAIVSSHDGVDPSPPPQLVRLQPSSSADKHLLFHGEAFHANLSSNGVTYEQTIFDITLVEDRELHGATASVWNASEGDRFYFTIEHPQAGTVAELARQVWVPPDGKLYPIVSEKTEPLFTGLILRIKYDTLAQVTKPYVIINFIYRRSNPV